MKGRIVYGVILLTAALALLGGFVPQARDGLWSVLLWGIVAIGIIVLLGVVGNVAWAMWSMYTGYGPLKAKPSPDSTNVVPIAKSAGNPEIVARPYSDDVLLELCRAECALSNLETSMGFHALTDRERARCEQVRRDVHTLVRDVSQHSYHEKVVS